MSLTMISSKCRDIRLINPGSDQRELGMSSIIQFPKDAASRRPAVDEPARERMGTVVILPVVRIERVTDSTRDGGPTEGAASGRRRRRRS